jgi:hypothetical protein
MRGNEKLKEYALPDIKNMKVHGRTTGVLSPLTLFWTGSGVEWDASGSELWIEVESTYDSYEPWISIIINAVPVSRIMLTAGRYWICVFRGMNENTVKNVRIVKDLQAMSDDPGSCLQLHAVKSDGEFMPAPDKPYKLEFIGDSITSGEGAIGAKEEEDWIPMWFSAVDNYAAITAQALNTDYRIISQSGWGVLTSWDNNPHCNIPDYYEMVCGVLDGERNEALGAHQENDFASWQPDVIVVNLGTNDNGAFYSPQWKDETTGETHKQRLNEDGSFNEEDLSAFEAAAGNFLVKLRKYNKAAHIVWVYGMLGLQMLPAIKRAADAYIKKTGDRKVSVLQLSETTPETVGARSHPGLPAHRKAAEELTEYIKKLLSI